MPGLLVCHELNEISIFSGQASVLEVLVGEGGKAIVEEVELDPLLVKGKHEALVVEITQRICLTLDETG